jgi:hypothetical protein
MPDISPFPFNTPSLIPLPNEDVSKEQVDELKQQELDKFKKLQSRVKKLHDSWSAEIIETRTRRDLRYVEIDPEEQRQGGNLKPDETYIPLRIIHANITAEQAQYISYLTTSQNTITFRPKTRASGINVPNPELLEQKFTSWARYPGWQLPHFKIIDGAQMHGSDFVEVVFDKNKPGFFSVEHIAHENCWYPLDTVDIQEAPIVVRNCKLTKDRLMEFADVNIEQVELLFKNKTDDETNESTESKTDVQKVFYRDKGTVMVCWLSHDKGTDYIRKPKPLSLGRRKSMVDVLTGNIVGWQDIFETQYPLRCFQYSISEDGKIFNIKGRVFYDEYIQEAVSILVSSIVNGYFRASQVFAAPKNPITDGVPEQTEINIEGGKIYTNPLEFFHTDYPDTGAMGIVQALLTQNKAEAAQINFAAMNRKDSRKTAKEISAAQTEQAMLSGVQVTLYSLFLREVYSLCWEITQSLLNQGLIKDSELTPPYYNGTFEWEVQAAGDTEVIKRDETLMKLQSALPLVSNTPASVEVLKDILNLAFPSNAPKYIAALNQANPAMIVGGLVGILKTLVTVNPEIFPPDQLGQVQALIAQGESIAPQAPAQT